MGVPRVSYVELANHVHHSCNDEERPPERRSSDFHETDVTKLVASRA